MGIRTCAVDRCGLLKRLKLKKRQKNPGPSCHALHIVRNNEEPRRVEGGRGAEGNGGEKESLRLDRGFPVANVGRPWAYLIPVHYGTVQYRTGTIRLPYGRADIQFSSLSNFLESRFCSTRQRDDLPCENITRLLLSSRQHACAFGTLEAQVPSLTRWRLSLNVVNAGRSTGS